MNFEFFCRIIFRISYSMIYFFVAFVNFIIAELFLKFACNVFARILFVAQCCCVLRFVVIFDVTIDEN